jgi:hypothetical protein
MEDVGYGLGYFGWVADFIIDYSCLVEDELVIDVDVLGSEVQCISAAVVEFVNVDAVEFVVDYLELPFALLR